MVLLALLLGLLYRSGVASVKLGIADQQRSAVNEAHLAMTSYMDWVQRDVVYLGRLGRHINAGHAGSTNWVHFEQAFVDLVSTRGEVYAQARYIDETGMERARVDSQDTRVAVIPADQLQNKGHRYYFQQAMEQPAGAVYLSRFDLNFEHGEIEVPYNPVVRFSTKVRDASGRERGLVVLNVRAQPLIDRIKGMQLPEGAELWLLNRNGGWMLSRNTADEWRFMDPSAKDAFLGDRRPELWSAIKSSSSEVTDFYNVKGGLLSAKSFPPQELLKIQGIDLRSEADMTWYFASWLPESALPVYLKSLRQRVLVALGVLGCLFLAIAFCGAHLLVNRRQAKEAQARSEAQYRQLLESAPDAIVAADTSGTMVYANERAVELFGYSQDELQGKKVDALIPPRFRDVHLGHDSRYARALPGLHEMAKGRELYALHRDGREFPAIIALNKIEGPGGQRVIATIHDVTELRQIQAAMAQTNQQLQVSNKNLESFSYSIAHDLRAPLRVLNGFSQILLAEFGDKLDEQARNCADRINSASEHMGSILNGMLALSQVTSSKLVLEDLDMSLLASEVNELLSDEHVDREVEVRIEPGMRARGDRSLIMIVLQNLLSSAVASSLAGSRINRRRFHHSP
jgi:PAS domain S-box-containing protein